MKNLENVSSGDQTRALTTSTLAFTVCFAVWTIFSIIGIKIKGELGLSDTQFGLLVATPILTGSLSRIFLGIWTDQYGGRIVYTLQMLTSALAAFFLTYANTYEMYLVGALGLGLSGGSFAVGIAYVSSWYPDHKQGTALGIFGAGNVGAAVTNFGAPILLVAMGGEWRSVVYVYAGILAITAVLFFLFSKTDPAHSGTKQEARPFMEQLKPLKHLIVWRFSLYYFFILIIYHRHISTYYNIYNIIYFFWEVKGKIGMVLIFYNREACLSASVGLPCCADRLSISLYGNVRVVGVKHQQPANIFLTK